MELKEFRFAEDEGTQWESQASYPVLYVPPLDWESERWVINCSETHPFTVYRHEIDRYLEILTWIKAHAEVTAPSEVEEEQEHADAPNPVEEDG